MKRFEPLDQEEKDLMFSLEHDGWISDFNKNIKKRYEEYAKHSLAKQTRINIRMTERDLRKIRVKATQAGLPYQSLITMLIHGYNDGKVLFKS
jgi:predicted DNA binding CopG/RHH family protein